ncbi:hypothetical protein X961_4000 [Burkholderia pseudomallei MSHR5613]|nr:hypothetical protein X961_4000 [Burkholderia pseudomallei MSHR5613]KGS96595.1 hypothetical protein X963_6179 [Burkholderia pseudomallei MSHR7498]
MRPQRDIVCDSTGFQTDFEIIGVRPDRETVGGVLVEKLANCTRSFRHVEHTIRDLLVGPCKLHGARMAGRFRVAQRAPIPTRRQALRGGLRFGDSGQEIRYVVRVDPHYRALAAAVASCSTSSIRSPIQRITDTAMLLPSAL